MNPRTGTVEQLRTTIEHDAYSPDAGSIADAIIRRLLDGRSLR